MEQIQPINDEDILLWPDGSWCQRQHREEHYGWMDDEYEVVPYGTPRWENIVEACQ